MHSVTYLAEECAFRVLTNCKENGEEEPGIPYVTEVYSYHKDNAEVVEAICALILELCQYGERSHQLKGHIVLFNMFVTCLCCCYCRRDQSGSEAHASG